MSLMLHGKMLIAPARAYNDGASCGLALLGKIYPHLRCVTDVAVVVGHSVLPQAHLNGLLSLTLSVKTCYHHDKRK